MTVLLVLCTFILFLLIDYFMSRNKATAVFMAAHRETRPSLPALVNGFRFPENLLYHPGHTWALGESPTLVRIGMDEFAAKLLGNIDSIKLPARNTWVKQGQKFATITRGDKTVDLISPIEGVVADVNEFATIDPNGARKDSFGAGWLLTVQAPDRKVCFRNLFSGRLAKWWLEDAVARIHPALAQDGGEAMDDFVTLVGKDWEATAKEFLLN